MPRTGNVSDKNKIIVWARAAGICSKPGCGERLHRDARLSRRAIPFGQIAHNVAASPDMVRGHLKRSEELVDDPDNLILLCPNCHTVIDKKDVSDVATEQLLRDWKTIHEKNVELLASCSPTGTAAGLIATGEIRQRPVDLDSGSFVRAALANGFHLRDEPALITLPSAAARKTGTTNWDAQADALTREVRIFTHKLRPNEPIIVAGLAEIPSLVYLGFLLGNEVPLVALQPSHTGEGMSYSNPDAEAPDFLVKYPDIPKRTSDCVNLVLSLSAEVDLIRVEPWVNSGEQTIELTIDAPNRGLVNSRSVVQSFARTVFELIDRIERDYGHDITLRLFPAVPAPLAVVFGSQLSPKIGGGVEIFDASGPQGHFEYAIKIETS